MLAANMRRFWWFIVGAIAGLVSHEYSKADVPPMERTVCLPAPEEIAHMDDKGLCSITKRGRVVTRFAVVAPATGG